MSIQIKLPYTDSVDSFEDAIDLHRRDTSTLLATIKDACSFLSFSNTVHSPNVESSGQDSPVAWHDRRLIFATAIRNSIFLYNQLKGAWHSPPLKFGSRKTKVFCLSWAAKSDTLVAGTTEGLYVWRFGSLSSDNIEHINPSVSQLPCYLSLFPQKQYIRALQNCPHGRLFCTLSSLEGDRCARLLIWDLFTLDCTELDILPSGIGASGLVINWSPSGEYIAIGTSLGNVLVVDCETWDHTLLCSLSSAITNLQWCSHCDIIVSSQSSLLLHVISVSNPKTRRHAESRAVKLPEPICGDVSPCPLDLNAYLQDILDDLKHTQQDVLPIDGGNYEVACIGVDITEGFMAVAFRHIKENKVLPFIALSVFRSRPFLTISLVRVIAATADAGAEAHPIKLMFRPFIVDDNTRGCSTAGSSSLTSIYTSTLLVVWSTEVISLELCSVK